MTDPSQQTATPAPQSSDDKNPLDVLEDILKDAKAKGQGGGQSGPTEEEIAAQKEAEELAKAEEMMKQRKMEDQQKLAEQIGQLASIKDTPEYQARVDQIAEKQEEEQTQEDAEDGFEIVQVGHSKI